MEEKIVKILLNNLDCEAIVLFGSYSRGTQNAESDIDIAIKIKEKLDKKELTISEVTKAYVDRIIEKEDDIKEFVREMINLKR